MLRDKCPRVTVTSELSDITAAESLGQVPGGRPGAGEAAAAVAGLVEDSQVPALQEAVLAAPAPS